MNQGQIFQEYTSSNTPLRNFHHQYSLRQSHQNKKVKHDIETLGPYAGARKEISGERTQVIEISCRYRQIGL